MDANQQVTPEAMVRQRQDQEGVRMTNYLNMSDMKRQRQSQEPFLNSDVFYNRRQQWTDKLKDMIFEQKINQRSPNVPANAYQKAVDRGQQLIQMNYYNMLVARGDTHPQWDALAFTRSIPKRSTVVAEARAIYGN